jgi:hypothetical protein
MQGVMKWLREAIYGRIPATDDEMRRFTRLTNALSKKIENHACAIAFTPRSTTSFASIRRLRCRQQRRDRPAWGND